MRYSDYTDNATNKKWKIQISRHFLHLRSAYLWVAATGVTPLTGRKQG